jgi:DNA-binding MarR family transcriptional regulator
VAGVKHPGRDVSLLFDLFVVNQRVRRVLAAAMTEGALRPDEYAVYSLLFEQAPLTATEMARRMGMPLTTILDYLRSMTARGHIRRDPHPSDGRAQQVSLTPAGLAEHRRTNAVWEVVRARLEASLPLPIDQVRSALHALDDAAAAVLENFEARPGAGQGWLPGRVPMGNSRQGPRPAFRTEWQER